MAKYCVNTNAQDNGDHEVHKYTWEWLPAEKNRKYLGIFDNCHDAVKEAKKYYPNTSDGCRHCLPECHTR